MKEVDNRREMFRLKQYNSNAKLARTGNKSRGQDPFC